MKPAKVLIKEIMKPNKLIECDYQAKLSQERPSKVADIEKPSARNSTNRSLDFSSFYFFLIFVILSESLVGSFYTVINSIIFKGLFTGVLCC